MAALFAVFTIMLSLSPSRGKPVLPLLRVVPSYGSIYAVLHVLGVVVDFGAAVIEHESALARALTYNLIALAMDAFAVGMLAMWIYNCNTGALSVADANHHSMSMALFDLALTIMLMILRVHVSANHSEAINVRWRMDRWLWANGGALPQESRQRAA
jgi:hypothetical protein